MDNKMKQAQHQHLSEDSGFSTMESSEFSQHSNPYESAYHSGQAPDIKPVPKERTDRPTVARDLDSGSMNSKSMGSNSIPSDQGYCSGSLTPLSKSSSGSGTPSTCSKLSVSSSPGVTAPLPSKWKSFQLFFKWLLDHKPKWTEWTPNSDIAKQLSPELLKEGRELLWTPEGEEGDCEALNAARDGDENVVAMAVLIADHHKVLNTKNNLRQTLLHLTSENEKCSAKLSRLVITRGADGAIPDVWGNTPLHIACEKGRADVITALCLPLTKPEVKHPFYKCPYKSLPQDNVNSYNHDGRAPVHLAAEHKDSLKHREAIAAMYMYAKCNIDYRRLGDGYSASHIAIDNDDENCLQVCLEAKADSEVRNYKCETPQQLAYLLKNHQMVRLCQRYGAGSYQLDHAETEPVVTDSDEEDMDLDLTEEQIAEHFHRAALADQMQSLRVAQQNS